MKCIRCRQYDQAIIERTIGARPFYIRAQIISNAPMKWINPYWHKLYEQTASLTSYDVILNFASAPGAATLPCLKYAMFVFIFIQSVENISRYCKIMFTKHSLFGISMISRLPSTFSNTLAWQLGTAVAEWLSSWLAEQEDRGSIPGLAIWIFRDWLSPASKSRYGWKIAKSTLILKITNQPIV